MSELVSSKPIESQAGAGASTSAASAAAAPAAGYRLPEPLTFQSAAKWAIIEDRPIMMDYWTDSLEKKAFVGLKDNQEKLLVKSGEEYTSPIAKIFKNKTDLIIMTENSIYVVDAAIDVKKIS